MNEEELTKVLKTKRLEVTDKGKVFYVSLTDFGVSQIKNIFRESSIERLKLKGYETWPDKNEAVV